MTDKPLSAGISPSFCRAYIGSNMVRTQWVHTHILLHLSHQLSSSQKDWPWSTHRKQGTFRNMEINVPVHLSTSHVPCILYIYVIRNAGILNEYCDIKGSLLYIYENKNSSTKLSYKVQGDTKVESIFLIIPLKSKITWHSASILLFLYIYYI